jgi:hypothetical protein
MQKGATCCAPTGTFLVYRLPLTCSPLIDYFRTNILICQFEFGLNWNGSGDGRITLGFHQVVRDLAGHVIVDQMVRHLYVVDDEGFIRSITIEQWSP